MSEKFEVLLYYLYTEITNPKEYRDAHYAFCERLNLKGRISISAEGINGTVSGKTRDTSVYCQALLEDPLTKQITFKKAEVEEFLFPKLSVKVRREIVTLSQGNVSIQNAATPLSPLDFERMIEEENTVILDARNAYESRIGYFEGAILPNIQNFRELPQWVKENENQLKGKKILTYCTGGIRCEKFSAFLKEEGFKEVYQLRGGIVDYGKDEQTKGKKFKGSCYVFDSRISIPINQQKHIIVAFCDYCGNSCDTYKNCKDLSCNARYIGCESCAMENQNFCPKCSRERKEVAV